MQAYKYYKPIGVATTAEPQIHLSEKNNGEGVIFARKSSDFGKDFIAAVAQQRFWGRI